MSEIKKHPNPEVAKRMETVYATEKNTYKATGDPIHCAPKMAEHLIAIGMASKEAAKGKTKEQKDNTK